MDKMLLTMEKMTILGLVLMCIVIPLYTMSVEQGKHSAEIADLQADLLRLSNALDKLRESIRK
jgi:hypothetical protein